MSCGSLERATPTVVSIQQEIFRGTDISDLDPRQFTDYHFAVTALQLEGGEVFLSDIAHDAALSVVEKTQYDLVVASADAITKEIIPSGLGATIGGMSACTTKNVKAVTAAFIESGSYADYIPPAITIDMLNADGYDEDFARLAYGMRAKLREQRDDPAQVLPAVADIIALSQAYFTEDRIMKEEDGAPIFERGWHEFSGYLKEYLAVYQEKDWRMTAIQASRLINSLHESVDDYGERQPMVMRFTNHHAHPGKEDAYIAALNATMGSYEDLLQHAGYTGNMLYGYVTGQQKSLDRLPADRAVPLAFVNLLA
jgi:hypothetical protein